MTVRLWSRVRSPERREAALSGTSVGHHGADSFDTRSSSMVLADRVDRLTRDG
jgi:hypothetical protein